MVSEGTPALIWAGAAVVTLLGPGLAASTSWSAGPATDTTRTTAAIAATTSPSSERMADTLGCQLADNATLDPIVFTGATEPEAVRALEAEVRVRAERWEGDLLLDPGEAMAGESAWLLYDMDGTGHGIMTAGLGRHPERAHDGQWVAYLTDLCQGALAAPTSIRS